MIDHFNLPVSNLLTSRNFYKTVMHTLGLEILVEETDAIGFGQESWTFGIVEESSPFVPIHLAFRANSRSQVNAFYLAAMKAGGRDNGPPGVRAEYGPNYYSAYVLDIDGHNVEAVCRDEA